MKIHYRRTWIAGLLPLGIALLMALGQPAPGPGWYAVNGLALAGLLLLSGMHGLPSEPHPSRLSRWLGHRVDQWFPATLIILQSYFIALTVLLLWFATTDLGFPAAPLHHALLIFLLALSPLRRVLDGTQRSDSSPFRELVVEFLRFLNAAVVAIFFAALFTRLMIPPSAQLTEGLPAGLVLVWVPAVLVVITCVILMIDHVLRKMPAPPAASVKDTLD